LQAVRADPDIEETEAIARFTEGQVAASTKEISDHIARLEDINEFLVADREDQDAWLEEELNKKIHTMLQQYTKTPLKLVEDLYKVEHVRSALEQVKLYHKRGVLAPAFVSSLACSRVLPLAYSCLCRCMLSQLSS